MKYNRGITVIFVESLKTFKDAYVYMKNQKNRPYTQRHSAQPNHHANGIHTRQTRKPDCFSVFQ